MNKPNQTTNPQEDKVKNDKALTQDIDNAVVKTVWQLIREPLTYFSEADIQQLLVQNLNSIKALQEPVPTSMARGLKRLKKDAGKESDAMYATPRVHCEYGGGEGTRIDVVVFDPEDVKKINGAKLTFDDKYLNPSYAFELGTESAAASRLDTQAHVDSDLKKLTRSLTKGYLIHFYRNVALTKVGTERRDKNEARIEENFKNVLKEARPSSEKIRIIAVVRHIRRKKNTCAILEMGKWNPINSKSETKAKERLRKILE
jgi:hypothetical protein